MAVDHTCTMSMEVNLSLSFSLSDHIKNTQNVHSLPLQLERARMVRNIAHTLHIRFTISERILIDLLAITIKNVAYIVDKKNENVVEDKANKPLQMYPASRAKIDCYQIYM